jgi:acetyltransferase-like isoleucine patch superfamily enzyme
MRVSVENGCYIDRSAVIGKNVKIKKNVTIGLGVTIGDNVIIGAGASLSRISIGNNTHIESGVKITGHGNGFITLGRDCYVGINNVLDWSESINIGDFVHIAGPSTGIWTHSSAKQVLLGESISNKDIDIRPKSPVLIESNVYIGGNCTIYPGVKIGHHSVVAPNSAVTKNIEPFSLVGGVPAKFIKSTKPE